MWPPAACPCTAKSDEIPLAEVKRGEIDLEVHATGELRASHSMMLSAPAVGGDALQITHLVRTGQPVKKGDVVFEFDPSEQHYKLEQNRSELLQAEQEITKAKADAAVLAAEDKVTLLKDRYSVRRAELDVQKNELVSKIDADKNELALRAGQAGAGGRRRKISSRTRHRGRQPLILRRRSTTRPRWHGPGAAEPGQNAVTAPMDGLVSIQKEQECIGRILFHRHVAARLP